MSSLDTVHSLGAEVGVRNNLSVYTIVVVSHESFSGLGGLAFELTPVAVITGCAIC